MLIRRVVPAIVATLAVYAGLAFAAGGLLREHYLTPLLISNPNVPGSAWIISRGGPRAASSPSPFPPTASSATSALPFRRGPSASRRSKPVVQCLSQHGYTQWTSYQPASRFWPFQWIEGGWLLALSVLLIAATIWLVRRRAA